MEWEEALLRAWGGEMSPQSAAHYRRRAARARQLADWMTTPVEKVRLLDDAAAAISLRLVPTSSREKPEVYRRYRADETLQRAELMGELLTSRPTIPST